MTRCALCALLASTALSPLAVFAQDNDFELPSIVVSGGLTPVASETFGRANTVITAEDLENQNKSYVADVLRTVPGLAVSRTGAFGGLTQVRIRGNEGNATKVIIDGIDVSSASQGEFDFGSLLTADIERIEVLRGPQSSIYGSNAMGGVISITTKRATKPGVSGSFNAEVGTDNSINTLIASRFAAPRGDLSVSIAGFQTDGFDVSGTDDNDKDFLDGSENVTVNANGRYFATETVTLGAVVRYTDRSVDSDDDVFAAPTIDQLVANADNRNDTTSLYGLAFAEVELLEGRVLNRFELSAVDEESESFEDGDQTFGNESGRTKFSYVGTLALDAATLSSANHTLSFSYQWQEERFQQTNGDGLFFPPPPNDPFFDKQERTQQSTVLEYRGSFLGALDLQASVRYDDNEDFEDFTSYAVGASYFIAPSGTRVHASVGTASVNPTFSEQFGFFNNYQGNPDLKPEESFGWDIGVEQSLFDGRGLLDVTYFQEDLENEIRDVFSTSINLDGTSHRRGVEVTGQYTVSDALDLSLAYTYLDGTEEVPTEAGGSRDVVEVRRPEHDLYLQGTYTLPNDQTSVTLGVQYVSNLYDLDFRTASFISGEFDDDFDRVKLDDYLLVDVSFRHAVSDTMTITGAITNLTDEEYQELAGYATQGRTLFLGVAASF
ncbi:MAG: TonB-dependent receptor [Pseudomonadota bacterium]